MRIGQEAGWNVALDSIKEGAFVVSGGAGKDISFELELAKKKGCRMVLLDPSPTGANTVRTVLLPSNIFFEKKALSKHSGIIYMSKPQDMKEGSWRLCLDGKGDAMESTCLTDVIKEHDTALIDLLKIDIEGYEYEVLKDAIEKKIPIQQICVEIHEGESFGKTRFDRWALILRMILSGYRLIYQKGWDYTFLRSSA